MNDELTERLASLVKRHRLSDGAYAGLHALDAHLADSLTGLEIPALTRAARIADLGSGAGFPGVPLAVALPTSHVNLVESQTRKCAFLGRLIVAAGLANAEIVNARAEEWAAGIGVHDAIVARAVATSPVVLEYAAPLLKTGGVLVDWRGRRNPGEERVALSAARELGLERVEVRRAVLLQGAREHHLHVYSKTRPTPERFPRRPGVARKRPLGSARQRVAAAGDRDRR